MYYFYTRAYENSWPTRLARMCEMCGLERFNVSSLAIGRFEPNLNLLLYTNEVKIRPEILPCGRFKHTLSKYAKKSNPKNLTFVTVRNVIDNMLSMYLHVILYRQFGKECSLESGYCAL